ncbi:hypothetical protein ASPWEDRAFT_733041 [Aspergillus wentii DTO 134E9]|uniref:Protein ROT1 n=1 Tax=Aspergillus wentii DTO 134E9 TaxID=1073089 RepID=A0A1L9S426_ASPWE|nr:uncharacterized protein ASPWEDRAFT_733041 [Aspergillus wentii DTO 134E9]KAI9930226.1 Reversal of tor2 lethality [Aspergillus wentii]OJJ41901.1 hypothetical protein ASPWEDRAFT_733041 [Aspergillus wentii DTO 134E9]
MIAGFFFFFGLLVTAVSGASVSDLVGTWTTKSRSVFTGPGFFDPAEDRLIEPSLTGISYSFTANGHYEEAHYRALANPQDPSCPKGIMQWQHGTYSVNSNGSVSLNPIAVDGRQLLSDPCAHSIGIYTRYNQSELFDSYTVSIDPYHGIKRLDLYAFDGSPMHPMYLAYKPPQILPTSTLNPIHDKKRKRQLGGETEKSFSIKHLVTKEDLMNPDRWLWFGIVMTSLGGVAFFYS